MRDMKIFNHKEFGELSILIINGKEYFPLAGVLPSWDTPIPEMRYPVIVVGS